MKGEICAFEKWYRMYFHENWFLKNLGKLTTSLGIKIEKRHRADGDAMATLKLFKILLEKDKTNVIDRLTK